MSTDTTPSVRCPTCYVSAGRQCVTVHGNKPTKTHSDREARNLGFDSTRAMRQHYRGER